MLYLALCDPSPRGQNCYGLSLVGVCRRFFTFGIESHPLTYDGEVLQGRGAERKFPSLCPKNRDSPSPLMVRRYRVETGAPGVL